MSFGPENKTAISIFLGAALIAGALYFGLTQSKPSLPFKQPANQVSPSPTVSPQPSPELKPTDVIHLPVKPTPEITWKKSDLVAALSQKTGIAENEIEFSVGDQIRDTGRILLRGTVRRQGEMGGAGFFAVVDKNGVKVTYAGQGVPQCSEVNPYGYPVSWADYCLNQNGNTVSR